MKKLFTGFIVIIALLGCNLFSPSTPKEYTQAEYTSTKGVANPSQETKIELEDGAAIIIPANSTESEVTVTVERNPEKSKSLPPLGDDVVQLGNFYNFDVSGGTLIDGVDLVLPFDESRIPQKDGMLVIAIPNESGWEFVPVEAEGNKVTYYTANVGDPLIAWHFVPIDGRIDLSYETKEELAVCDEHIQLDISPASGSIGTEIRITGQVLPVRKGIANWEENWDKLLKFKTAANVPVNLYFGSSYVGNGYGSKNVFDTISVSTDEDGRFEASYTIDHEGYGVHITSKAQCDKWFGTIPVPSEGRVYFRLTQPIVEQPASTQPTDSPLATEPTASTEEPIPTGAVLLPDFVGQPIDEAINWLEANDFKYTWIDGSSTYDLGAVYKQAPVGNRYKVPHRTVVVLYRTVEKIDDPCSTLGLTPEECANMGTHTYAFTGIHHDIKVLVCVFNENGEMTITKNQEINIEFSKEGVKICSSDNDWCRIEFSKTGRNTYIGQYTDNSGTFPLILTFGSNGFSIEDQNSDCPTSYEFIRSQ